VKNHLKDLDYVKKDIPDEFHMYSDKIEDLEGNSNLALWVGTLAFGTGFASLAVFGPTM